MLEKVLSAEEFIRSPNPCGILKTCILSRLHLPAVDCDDLLQLTIMSIKLQTQEVTQGELLTAIRKYDCHQTGLVAMKKALLLLSIENDLGVRLDDDAAADAKTVEQLCDLLIGAMERRVR